MVDMSVIMPCMNEERTISKCIHKVKYIFSEYNINGEIIVSDNSTDGSAKIAEKLGAKVIKHDKVGYGNSYLEAFKYAKGKYIVIGDSDNTYDFLDIPKILEPLHDGYDLVIGSRMRGYILPGSMKLLHKYIGNPLLNKIFSIIFKANISDTHSGFRAFKKDILDKLKLECGGMEFALEMITNAIKNNLKIKEIPIVYYPRETKSKLNSFKDGYRHLSFMFKKRFKDEG